MTRSSAVNKEREHLAAAIELLGLEIVGEPMKRERPDFLVKLRDAHTVGVELVRALDERLAGGRGARQRLKKKLRDALVAAGVRAHVNVSISDHTAAHLNTDRGALEAEVEAVVGLARATLERRAGGQTFERADDDDEEPEDHHFGWVDHEWAEMMGRRRHSQSDRHDLDGTGVQHLDALSIYPASEPRVWWSGSGGGQQSNIVQDAIDRKADDLTTYRQCGADEIWLLVIGSTGTGGALFIDDVEDEVFKSPYERTLFLELFERRCMFLNTMQPDALSAETDPPAPHHV